MELIPLPTKIEYKESESPNMGVLTCSPCWRGYGTTVGNALRRVLLSSMPGAAVHAIKIKGIDHEFSSIPNVKEDIIEIILKIKQIRLNLHGDEEVRLKLSVSKEGEVVAGDIEKNSAVEIANPDLKIFTMSGKKAKVEMEFLVSRGIGFDPTENKEKEKLETGVMSIDAIYTPIKNVGYKVENVRVGQMTNYEKLIMNIETDGTINGKEAVKKAADILISHFNLFAQDFSQETKSEVLAFKENSGTEVVSEDSEDKE